MRTRDYLIVGAGISGLATARELKRASRDVVLVDKGRRLGGRACSRTFADSRVDYGAQYFTARTELFQSLVNEALEEGVVREWNGVFPVQDFPRYVGSCGIRSFPEFLGRDLSIQLQCEISHLELARDHWIVSPKKGEPFLVKALVLTAPLPQSIALLPEALLQMSSELMAVQYHKTLAAVLSFSEKLSLPTGVGGIKHPAGTEIAWIGDNAHKYNTSNSSCITVHCSYEYSETNFETEEKAIQEQILSDLRQLQIPTRSLSGFFLHRWRFAEPKTILPQPFAILSQKPLLAIAGEAFSGPRIEGAFLSGHALGEALCT